MKIKKIERLTIIRIIFCIIAFLTIEKNKTIGKTLEEIVRKLDSPTRYEREQATVILRQADPLIVLEQFKREFRTLYHESKVAFAEKVLPEMIGEHVDSFFLEELRAGLKAHLEFSELAKRMEKDEQGYEYQALGKELYERDQWWAWVVRSRKDLSYVPSYDEIYRMFMKLNERGFPLSCFAQVLYKRDSSRAERDFEKLLFHPDTQMKLRGIWALEAIRFVPPFEATRRFFEFVDASVFGENIPSVVSFIYTFERQHLNLLLFLTSSPSDRIRSAADHQLSRIGYLTPYEKNEIMANVTTPKQRSDAWRKWWEEHKDDSEQVLRKRAVSVLVKQAQQQLTSVLLTQLTSYHEQNEIYPVFEEALLSEDKGLKDTALNYLRYIATQKKNPVAVKMLVTFCEKILPEEYGEYARYLVQIDDERARSQLLKMLATQCGEDTTWRDRIAHSIGMTGQAWAVEPLVRMVIEDSSSSAATALTFVEGSESAVPRLLEALLKQEDHLKRYPIVKAIIATGAEYLPRKLTRILPELHRQTVPTFKGGIRFDVLTLMESFPDPNAKPALLELLKSDNPWDNLGAARVLGKLGDDSGVDILINHIKRPENISASFPKNRIGEALLLIGSSKTRKLLERHFEQGDLDAKKLTLHVMAQQLDPAYIPFIEKQLESSEPEIASAALHEIGYLINSKRYNEDKNQLSDDFDVDILKEDDLPPIRNMLLWALFDMKITEDCKSFPNHRSLTKLKGAVIRVNRYQQIEFRKPDKSLTISVPSQRGLIASDGTRAGRQQPYAEGSVERSFLNEYMTIFLRLNYGGAGCLFKRDGKNWKAIGYLGGVIE